MPGLRAWLRRQRGQGLGSGLVPFLPRCVNLGKFLALLGTCFLLCELGFALESSTSKAFPPM